jgi:hypothetical protein
MSFQLITGNERFYVMGIYIPPSCMTGVDDLQVAWKVCPADCTPLIVGDLNIRFENPTNDRANAIVNLLEQINTTNLSHNFLPQQCSQQWRRAHWTFHMRRGGGVVLFTTRLFSGECAHPKEAQEGGILLARVPRLGSSGGSQPSGGGARIGSSHTNATKNASLFSLPRGRRLN